MMLLQFNHTRSATPHITYPLAFKAACKGTFSLLCLLNRPSKNGSSIRNTTVSPQIIH